MNPLEAATRVIRIETLLIVLIAGFALWRRLKASILLNGTGGLHTSVLLFMGVGPFSYTFSPDADESIPYLKLLETLGPPLGWFIIGYAGWVGLEYSIIYRRAKSYRPMGSLTSIRLVVLFVVAFGALAAHLTTGLSFTQSSLGTIFPVIEGLFYPVVLVALLRWRKYDFASAGLAIVMLTISVLLAFFSAWRSQLVILAACAALTLLMKFKRGILYAIPAVPFIMYVILPFQFLKRNDYYGFQQNKWRFVNQAIEMPWEDRNSSVVEFMGLRINTAREMAYVQAAVDSEAFRIRAGEGYLEAVEQLVPRIFWPDKPSFNDLVNKVLPRLIGLVGPDDDYTSWGVGLWAEFVLNFPYQFLPIFVFLMFSLTVWLDRLVPLRFRQITTQWLAHSALYFLFLTAVSMVMLLPYLLWTVLVLFVTDRFLDRVFGSLPSKPPARPVFSVLGHENLTLRRR